MSFGENISPLVGRCLIALLFALTAVDQLREWRETTIYILSHGIRFAEPALALALVIQLGGALALVLGFRTKLTALVLFIFTVTVSFLFHDFWKIDDAETARAQMQIFARNMAVAGGLLLLVGMGAGRWSYDSWRGD
jgi:putative oxidoreductase